MNNTMANAVHSGIKQFKSASSARSLRRLPDTNTPAGGAAVSGGVKAFLDTLEAGGGQGTAGGESKLSVEDYWRKKWVEKKSESGGAGRDEEEGEDEEEEEEEEEVYPSGMIGAFGNHVIRRVVSDRGDDEPAVVYHL